MSRQSRNTGGGGAAAASTTRMNEYFVPRDGIDREVISADICRYLGNDALVRPGHYDNPQTGQTVQGYYITAYRNLTTAMIEDLKADSARWDSERRALANRSMNATGGIQAARGGAGTKASVSNTELGQYRNSETHQSRQHHGPTDHNYPQENYRENSYDGGNRYPGTGTPGYNGATNYMQQQSHQPGFAPPSGGSGGYGGYQQPPQHAQDPRYNQGPGQSGSMMNQGYQDPAYVGAGANLQQQRGYQGNDNYGGRPVSTGNPQQPIYSTSAPQQPPYPPPSGSSYQYQGQMPQGNVPQYSNMQPQDPFYGRASPAGPPQQPGYQAQGQQLQQQQSSERLQRPPPRR